MSTLSVSNITDGTDTVETGYVVNGSAKAWVNFNGTGTIAIRDSLNVASLTDQGTGFYTCNLTSSFAATNFSVSGSVSYVTATWGNVFLFHGGTGVYQVDKMTFVSQDNDSDDSGYNQNDALYGMAQAFGDLA